MGLATMAMKSTCQRLPTQQGVGLAELTGDEGTVRGADGIQERQRHCFPVQAGQRYGPVVLIDEIEGRRLGVGGGRRTIELLSQDGIGVRVRRGERHGSSAEKHECRGPDRGKGPKGVDGIEPSPLSAAGV